METGNCSRCDNIVCDIEKRNVIEITICVHTIDGLIRMKNSTYL